MRSGSRWGISWLFKDGEWSLFCAAMDTPMDAKMVCGRCSVLPWSVFCAAVETKDAKMVCGRCSVLP